MFPQTASTAIKTQTKECPFLKTGEAVLYPFHNVSEKKTWAVYHENTVKQFMTHNFPEYN